MLSWVKNSLLQIVSWLKEFIFVSMEEKEVEMDLLKQLIDTFGPSGSEMEVRSIIQKAIKPYVDEVKVDKFGNLICSKKGKAPKVMLVAHMDEVGLMVRHIQADGRIRFSAIGGIDTLSILGQRVKIFTNKNPIEGVITLRETASALGDPAETPTLDELYVDTGLSNEELTKIGVRTGTYLNFHSDSDTLGSKDIICGKALDDRIGCYILIELAKKLKKVKQEIAFVFSVQEEVGLYGAKTSVYHVDPDWAIAVDVAAADDQDLHPTLFLGGGPSITVKDADMIANRCVNEWLIESAKKKKIPFQLDVSDSGTTDALTISLSKGGIPTAVVGVPVRNIHTPIGIAHRKDVENAIRLLETLLKDPPNKCVV
jgi:tetrahedral aminopeptidase